MKLFISLLYLFQFSLLGQVNDIQQNSNKSVSQIFIEAGKQFKLNILLEADADFSQQISAPTSYTNIQSILDHINKQFPIKWTWKSKETLFITIDSSVRFQIRSKEKNHTIGDVSIFNSKGEFICTSEPDGTFTLKQDELGKNYLFKHLNYDEKAVYLDRNNIQIELAERTYYSEPVQIVSDILPVTMSRRSDYRLEIHKEAMDELLVIGDFNEKMSFFSGITSIQQKNSGLSIQASPDNQHQLFFDRMTIYQQNHLFGFVSAINDEIVDKVNLYKGSYPARYGGRLSGIIDIESAKANFSRSKTVINADFLKADIQSQFNLSPSLNVLLSYRRSLIDLYSSYYTNDVLSFIQEKQYIFPEKSSKRRNVESKLPHALFYDLNSKVAYTISAKDYVSASFFKSLDENETLHLANLDIQRPKDDKRFRVNERDQEIKEWENHGFSFLWISELSKKWSTNLEYSNSTYKSSRLNSLISNLENTQLKREKSFTNFNGIEENSVRYSANYRFNPNQNFEFGYQFKQLSTEVNNNLRDSIEQFHFQRAASEYSNAIFFQQELLFDSLLLNMGIRFVRYSAVDELFIEPRLSFAYNFGFLRATINYSEQDQYLKHIYSHNFERSNKETFWLLATENFPVEHAKNVSLTLSRTGKNSESEFELFYNQTNGQIFSVDLYNRLANWNYSNSSGIREGLSLSHIQKINDLIVSLRYQFSTSSYQLDKIESDHRFYADNDHRHQIQANMAYNYNKFKFELSSTFKTGAPYSNINSDEQFDFDSYVLQINNARLEDFTQFNFSSQYSGRFSNTDYIVGLRIHNLLNKKNIWNSYYEFIPESKSFVRKDIEMIGILPSIFFRVSF
jgi:hypothetical protein